MNKVTRTYFSLKEKKKKTRLDSKNMIATQQKVKGRRDKYKIGMKTDWVTHINTWNITFVSIMIGPCFNTP